MPPSRSSATKSVPSWSKCAASSNLNFLSDSDSASATPQPSPVRLSCPVIAESASADQPGDKAGLDSAQSLPPRPSLRLDIASANAKDAARSPSARPAQAEATGANKNASVPTAALAAPKPQRTASSTNEMGLRQRQKDPQKAPCGLPAPTVRKGAGRGMSRAVGVRTPLPPSCAQRSVPARNAGGCATSSRPSVARKAPLQQGRPCKPGVGHSSLETASMVSALPPESPCDSCGCSVGIPGRERAHARGDARGDASFETGDAWYRESSRRAEEAKRALHEVDAYAERLQNVRRDFEDRHSGLEARLEALTDALRESVEAMNTYMQQQAQMRHTACDARENAAHRQALPARQPSSFVPRVGFTNGACGQTQGIPMLFGPWGPWVLIPATHMYTAARPPLYGRIGIPQ